MALIDGHTLSRAFGYGAEGLAVALWCALGIPVFVLAVCGISLSELAVTLPLLFGSVWLLRAHATGHRRWAARVLGIEIPPPYRSLPRGIVAKLRTLLSDPATWRDLLWALVSMTVGVVLAVLRFYLAFVWVWSIVVPFVWHVADLGFTVVGGWPVYSQASANFAWVGGVFALLLALWLNPLLRRTEAVVTASLLAPTRNAQLTRRVEQLSRTRAETVDTQAAELRRIERDLHDGAQARLVSLGMNIGLAEELLAKDPGAAAELLAEAKQSAGTALGELRDLVRGIHPPVLADRGLDGAVRALALDSRLPVDVDIDLATRLPAPVESAAYFAVAEALANIGKHSGATSGWVRIRHTAGTVTVLVGDNGSGGATRGSGGGLDGMAKRLAAFDGTLDVMSPAGGPTLLTMEIPADPVQPVSR